MLEHENIVPVLSYSEEGEFPYLVMPFIEGQTLKDYLASYSTEHGSGLPLSEVMQIGLELVRGLEVAHRFVNPESQRPQPMVHRDIKPGNIMVRVSNQSGERSLKVLIMDFGIAKVLSDQDTGHSLTEVIGTVKYASPEQIRRGKDLDPRADIYSLGMVLYELYAGRHMFTGMTEHGVLMRMVQRDLQDFEIPFPEGTPDRFRQLIERCVAVDREKRFANVGELRSLMRRILEEDSELVATEARQARDLARDERERALERGAGEFAAQPLAEGDDLIAQGDAAIADDRPKHAIPMLRAAAEVFARAAQEAVEGRERARLRGGLADLGKLQAAAAEVDAERLAPQAAAAALAAMRTLEGAIDSGNLTLGSRALAQAEQAWREAASQAAQERIRLAAVADCERLEAALGKIRAEIARLPERLHDAPELAELGVVEARVTNAREALAVADFAGASSSATSGLATLAEVETHRIVLLARTIDELSRHLETRLATVESSTDVQLAAPLHAEVRENADAARRLAGQRDAGAVAAIENALLKVQRLEAEVVARVAERDRALAVAERNRKAEPAARRAFDALQQARAALAAAGAPTAAEAADLAGAIAQADSASSQMDQGEYAEASPSLHAAAEQLAALAAAIAERVERERQLARLAELRNEAIIKSKNLGALGAAALEAPESKRLLSTLSSAEEHAAKGESAAAIRILERALPELDGRIAQAQSEIERARRRSEATTARTRASQAFEAARSQGDRATAASRYVTANADFERGERALAAENFAEATGAYNTAAQAFVALVAEIESALRAERLEALASRRAVLASKVTLLPRKRPFRRRYKEIAKSLAAADTALRDGVEQEAGRRIAETESLVNTLLQDAEAQEAESRLVGPPRALPWNAIAIGGGIAAIGIVATLTFFRRSPSQPLEEARAKPTAIVEPTMAPPLVTPPPLRPTALPTLAPTAAPTAVPTTVATAIPTAAATVAPTVVATPVPEPLSLAEARPASRVVKLSIGNEARFDASLKNGGDDLIEWRLGGETVGRGSTFVIHKELTAAPGKRRLEIFAGRDHPRTPLRAWDVDIEAPPLDFAALEPSSQTVERSSGSRVSFRAPVKAIEGEKLAFLWEVNGKPAEEAYGPTYDFQPQGPGEYVVQVRATAPWGASIANKWTLSVRPPPVPTPNMREDTPKADPRAEAQAWIEAYCGAFQKKDTDALIALGHLSSQDEAARLREALSSMGNLKVSCSNPSVRVNGDQAIVSFDRTDRWTDPRGTPMERALPRITKTLHKTNGRWIAVP
jgi:hypothetical protein